MTFCLYDNSTNKTYTKTVNTGSASDASPLYNIWNGTCGYDKHDTALKMSFSSFTEDYMQNLSAEATANCYIVPSAGKYKFNAYV